ncbi:hypothetical protein Mapa_005163 [Marchantia paleacea]|nr:hypothetical protein Mapa_005163 [Marchantia paleacea]
MDDEEDVFAEKVIGLTFCECIGLNSKTEILLAIARGENIDQQDPSTGDTPLYCLKGFADVAAQLLKMGADKDLKGEYGNTPLHLACSSSSVDCVNLLLIEGASVKVPNEFGNTPLQMAADINIKKKVKAISETGEIAKKALEAEEAVKRRAQLEAAEAARLAQEEIERKKKEEEAIIKAKRDAVAAEEAFSQPSTPAILPHYDVNTDSRSRVILILLYVF